MGLPAESRHDAATAWTVCFLYALSMVMLSAQPSPAVFALPPGWDKAVHAAEYAVLAAFLFEAHRRTFPRWSPGIRTGLAMGWLLVFALGDEIHQAHVPGRTAEVWDIVADGLGGLMLLGWRLGTGRGV